MVVIGSECCPEQGERREGESPATFIDVSELLSNGADTQLTQALR